MPLRLIYDLQEAGQQGRPIEEWEPGLAYRHSPLVAADKRH